MTSASLEKSPNVDDWLTISSDNIITIRTGKVDIGQRISTSLAIIAAEELDVDYDRIHVERTQTGEAPDEGVTAGSNSMEQSATAIRAASATARHHMLLLAAKALEVDVNTLEVSDGLITSRDINRSITYSDLMEGKEFGIAVDTNAKIKVPSEQTLVGTQVVPKDLNEIVTGNFQYVHDMTMDGMMHARVVRPPHYHARLKSLDENQIEKFKLEGTKIIINGSFIAVAHEDEYRAIKARDRMAAAVTWDLADGLLVNDLYEALLSNPRVSHRLVDGVPDDEPIPKLGNPPDEATKTISARYEKPYIMHASVAPSAAFAHAEASKIKIWCHSQGVYILRDSAAEALGMKPEDLVITHVPGPGCYGHNGADDVAFDAALVARALPEIPVLLKWTREDEHAWEPYGSAMVMELRGSLNKQGDVIEWSHDTYSDTHSMRPFPGPNGLGPGRLIGSRYMDPSIPPTPPQPTGGSHNGKFRNQDPLYTFPNRRIVKHLVKDLPLRCSSLRALGGYANIFALESFMDELSLEANMDAVDFRLMHLSDVRAKNVIEAAAEAFGWPGKNSEGVGCGLAFGQYKNIKTYAAVAIEVEVTDNAEIKLRRAVVAADAGHVIDPAGLIVQLEGGVIQAASWTLYEQVLYDRGGITSRDWDSYPILRFGNVPSINTILMERPGEPFLGAGEATTGPTAAAIANAVYRATGLRLRRLPLTPEAVKLAALN